MIVYKVVQIVGGCLYSAVLGPRNPASVIYSLNEKAVAAVSGTPLFAFESLDSARDFVRGICSVLRRRGVSIGIMKCEAEKSVWRPYQLPRRVRISVSEYWDRMQVLGFGVFFDTEPLPKGTVLCYSITPEKVESVSHLVGMDIVESVPSYQGAWS